MPGRGGYCPYGAGGNIPLPPDWEEVGPPYDGSDHGNIGGGISDPGSGIRGNIGGWELESLLPPNLGVDDDLESPKRGVCDRESLEYVEG